VTVALVVASALPLLYYGYSREAHTCAGLHAVLEDREASTDPQVLLAEANRLYWLNNGSKAAPLYARAEKLFAYEGNARDELYAKVGHLRSEAETMSFVDLSSFLHEQLQKPMVRNDASLHL